MCNEKVKLMLKKAMAKQMLKDIEEGTLKHPDSAPILRDAALRLQEGKEMTGLQTTHRQMNYWDAGGPNNLRGKQQ